jgi:hypothetical protein
MDEVLQPDEAKHSEPNKAFDNLARIFEQRFGNPDWNGPFLGKVVKAPPNLEVQIDERIILKADRIVVAWEKVAGYTRKFSEKGKINIEFDKFTVDSNDKDTGGNTHNTVSGSGSLKGNFTANGTNTWTDELKVGDEVILNEFKNQKKFYLVDKAYYYKAGE